MVTRKQARQNLKTFAKEIRHLVESEKDGHRIFTEHKAVRIAVLHVLEGLEKFLAQNEKTLDHVLGLASAKGGVEKGEGRSGVVARQIAAMLWAGKSKKQIAAKLGVSQVQVSRLLRKILTYLEVKAREQLN